jgi:hypothetical protein
VISEAVQAYLRDLELGRLPEPIAMIEEPVAPTTEVDEWLGAFDETPNDPPKIELGDTWFETFDESRHVAYQEAPVGRLGRLAGWLLRRDRQA